MQWEPRLLPQLASHLWLTLTKLKPELENLRQERQQGQQARQPLLETRPKQKTPRQPLKAVQPLQKKQMLLVEKLPPLTPLLPRTPLEPPTSLWLLRGRASRLPPPTLPHAWRLREGRP